MTKRSTTCSKQCSKASLNFKSVVILFECSNWEQYEIVFLKILANKKSHAGKDGPLQGELVYAFVTYQQVFSEKNS